MSLKKRHASRDRPHEVRVVLQVKSKDARSKNLPEFAGFAEAKNLKINLAPRPQRSQSKSQIKFKKVSRDRPPEVRGVLQVKSKDAWSKNLPEFAEIAEGLKSKAWSAAKFKSFKTTSCVTARDGGNADFARSKNLLTARARAITKDLHLAIYKINRGKKILSSCAYKTSSMMYI